MPAGFTIRALDCLLRVEFAKSASPESMAAAREQWRDLVVADDAPAYRTLTVGAPGPDLPDGLFVPDRPAEGLGAVLASRATVTAIEQLRGRAILLHAAAIALDDGRVVGFVGPSGRGKTTAVSELAKTYRYVTDETLAVLADGTVLPYPKPLLIGPKTAPKQAVPASGRGLRAVGDGPLRLAALVLLDRREGVPTPVVSKVGIVEALIGLARESSHLTGLDEPLARLIEQISATGGVRRIAYTEAVTLAGAIGEILATIGDEPIAFSTARQPPGSDGDRPAGTYRATPHDDAVAVADHLVVLHDGVITAIGGLAEVLWSAADDATAAELLAAALDGAPEPPPGVDPGAAVRDALQALVEAGLLQRAED